MVSDTSIPKFFSGKNVFITGGMGFMGKVLIEKLLRSCPEIGCIYLLIRKKKGQSSQERLNKLADLPLFQKLLEEYPKALEKIKPIEGDAIELELGIDNEDRQILRDNVHIFYHMAASVRFNDHLKNAILLNTRGTREAVSLALEIKNLLVFAHVSTAYSHCDKDNIEESVYPPKADWRTTIKIAEATDEYTLNILMLKYIDGLPNTYTFTKALSENVVYDMCNRKVPTIIVRPSIVYASLEEPVTGWTDNFNGPNGLAVATGIGLIRNVYAHDVKFDYIPVDIAIKGLIVASWHKATFQALGTKQSNDEICVYNSCGKDTYAVSVTDIIEAGLYVVDEKPMEQQLWYPNVEVTSSQQWNYVNILLFQALPAIFLDFLLFILKNQPRILRLQRKIYIACLSLEYFMTNTWNFHNDKFLALNGHLQEKDREQFYFDMRDVDAQKYLRNSLFGVKVYLLQEQPDRIEASKKKAKMLKTLHFSTVFLFYSMLLYMIYTKFVKASSQPSYTL